MSANYAAVPRDLPRVLTGACVVLIAIGVIAFIGGFAEHPDVVWRAFHVNYLYFGIMAQARSASPARS